MSINMSPLYFVCVRYTKILDFLKKISQTFTVSESQRIFFVVCVAQSGILDSGVYPLYFE